MVEDMNSKVENILDIESTEDSQEGEKERIDREIENIFNEIDGVDKDAFKSLDISDGDSIIGFLETLQKNEDDPEIIDFFHDFLEELASAYKDYDNDVFENTDYFQDYINGYFLPEIKSELGISEESDSGENGESNECQPNNEGIENYSQEYLDYLKENYPEFQYLINEYPDRMKEWENRMILFKELSDYIDKKSELYRYSDLSGLEEVKEALYRETDKEFFKEAKTESGEIYSGYSYLKILAQASNNTSKVMETFGEVDTEAIQNIAIDEEGNLTEQGEQMDRLETFLSALESKYDDGEFKSELMDIYEKLNKGKLDKAKEQTDELINTIGASGSSFSDWSTNFEEESFSVGDLVENDVNLVKALREIGARQQASKLSVENMQIGENDDGEMEIGIDTDMEGVKEENISKLESFMNGDVSKISRHGVGREVVEKSRIQMAREDAESNVDNILNTLMKSMEGHPNYFQYEQQKEQIRNGLIEMKATKEVLNDFIEKNGDDGLGEIMDIYNDMMGIDGGLFDNWSDASFERLNNLGQFVLETIIITALTFGAGLAIQAVRAGGRAVVAGTRAASSARSSRIADAANLRVTKNYNLEQVGNSSRWGFTGNMDIPRVGKSINVTGKSTGKTYNILNDGSKLLVTQGGKELPPASTLQILRTHFRGVDIAKDVARNPQQLRTHLNTNWEALSKGAGTLIVVNAGKYFLASEGDDGKIDLSEIDIDDSEDCEPQPEPQPGLEPQPILEPVPEPEPQPKPEYKEVEPGDTLSEIVAEHYGINGWGNIKRAVNEVVDMQENGSMKDRLIDSERDGVKGNLIYPGDMIKLPPKDNLDSI